MKRFACIALLVVSGPALAGGDWVNDWFSQETSTGPSSFSSQQRGYYTAGSFDARYRSTSDYLVSVQPPGIKIGCGGIDLMAGSLSYLNADYLVQKLERILQAAPAFAFQLAMQEYCKPCVAGLQFLDSVSEQLNQLQMNDCQAAKKVATAIVDPSTITADLQGISQEGNAIANGIQSNWEQFQSQTRSNNGTSPNPGNAAVAGCSSDFNKVFLSGSVVQNSAALLGLDSYAPVMRGLVGDIQVAFTNNAFSFTTRNACPGNDQLSGADLRNGTFQVMDAGGNCTQSNMTTVMSMVDTQVNGIASQISSGQQLSTQQLAFVNAAPLPLFNVLRDSTQGGNASQMISLLDDTLASGYTWRVLNDLYQAIQQALNRAQDLAKSVQSASTDATSGGKCDVTFLAPELSELKDLRDRSLKYREVAQQAYAKAVSEAETNLTLSHELYAQRVDLLNRQGNTLDRNK